MKMSDEQKAAMQTLVGHHRYFGVSVFDAVDRVQRVLQEVGAIGWRAGYDRETPDGDTAISVGSVQVRHGDPDYVLFIRPITLL